MKKKPHQKQSSINQIFSDFRARLHVPNQPQNGIEYEVVKNKSGYTVILHKERGANQRLHFADQEQLDAYLASI